MDTSQYDKAMDDAIAKAKTLNDTLNGATVGGSASGGGGTTSTGSGMSTWKVTVGNLMSDVVRKGAQLAWDFTVEGIDLASAKNEVQNVVDVTFGSYSDALNEWAKNAKALVRPPRGASRGAGDHAQGDFARTLDDSLANQQRLMEENIKELQTKWGEGFLGVATNVFSNLNEMFGSGEPTLEETFAAYDQATAKASADIMEGGRQAS